MNQMDQYQIIMKSNGRTIAGRTGTLNNNEGGPKIKFDFVPMVKYHQKKSSYKWIKNQDMNVRMQKSPIQMSEFFLTN